MFACGLLQESALKKPKCVQSAMRQDLNRKPEPKQSACFYFVYFYSS